MQEVELIRELVRQKLERPLEHEGNWTVQGLGMLRFYIDPAKRWRVNIWHSDLAVPNVSTLHDHPWDFISWVLSGKFCNIRYSRMSTLKPNAMMTRIVCGEDGGPDGDVIPVHLREHSREHYVTGDKYEQLNFEIHESKFQDNTVTINDRVIRPERSPDKALVFWWPHVSEQWVDAKPRLATQSEILKYTELALAHWQ